MWRRAILIAAVLGVSACSTGVTDAPTQEPTLQVGVQQVSDPQMLDIPKIGVHVPLVSLGLTPERAVEVPPVDKPEEAGWFEPGPEPGEPGKSLILGHVNGRVKGVSTPGVFARLHELNIDDQIIVDDKMFAVTAVQNYPKDKFPKDLVFGNSDSQEIRLVTCGGDFDYEAHSYKDNVVVSGRRM